MPLDVQPLSRGRRWAMIGVLAILLAASVGFAEWLTLRTRHQKYEPPKATTIEHDDNG